MQRVMWEMPLGRPRETCPFRFGFLGALFLGFWTARDRDRDAMFDTGVGLLLRRGMAEDHG
jgi:hypothetical protein